MVRPSGMKNSWPERASSTVKPPRRLVADHDLVFSRRIDSQQGAAFATDCGRLDRSKSPRPPPALPPPALPAGRTPPSIACDQMRSAGSIGQSVSLRYYAHMMVSWAPLDRFRSKKIKGDRHKNVRRAQGRMT